MISASTIASFVADLAVGIFKKMFAANRDEAIGALKVVNKDEGETIADVKKVNDARAAVQSNTADSVSNDPQNLDR